MKRIIAIIALCAVLVMPCALADTPSSFSFSGGTGKVTITCADVTVTEDGAVATLVFSSPNYTQAVLDGVTYEAVHEGDTSTFTVPVTLNRAFDITATTTAMSRPHDVTYTIYIGMGDDGLGGLTYTGSMALTYAKCFRVDYYDGGYALLSLDDGQRFLLIPEGQNVPDGLSPDITPLHKPINRAYMAASSVMALASRLDALNAVRFSALTQDGWHVDVAAQAMGEGSILYAGKYSEPDYELLVKEDCDLAIESTMILHTPKVQELIELLGIPVLIDHSSYEPHPMGRTEWIKLYGEMFDRQDEAQAYFAEQADAFEALAAAEPTDLNVGYFYISTDGRAVVRADSDYVASMVRLAGGNYAFAELTADHTGKATVSVTFEDFYQAALGADYLIYDTVIDSRVTDLSTLLSRSALLADLPAVQQGRVYLTGANLYQATDEACAFIGDIHAVLTGSGADLTFLTHAE